MTRILANASAQDRSPVDFYETPSDVTNALLDLIGIQRQPSIWRQPKVWEPAAGNGMMALEIRRRGCEVVETDLYHGQQPSDFLQATAAPRDVNWIITNPPFSQAELFIRQAARLAPVCGGFAFLLKSQFWHAAKRLSLFNEIRPFGVYPLSWRPDFLFGAKSGAPTMEVLWSVWRSPYDNRTTEFTPLPRPIR